MNVTPAKLKSYNRIIQEAEQKLSVLFEEPINVYVRKRFNPDCITLNDIKEQVTKEFAVSWENIVKLNRAPEVANARHSFCSLCYTELSLSAKQIGAIIDRDRLTVRKSIYKVRDMISVNDPAITKAMSKIQYTILAKKSKNP